MNTKQAKRIIFEISSSLSAFPVDFSKAEGYLEAIEKGEKLAEFIRRIILVQCDAVDAEKALEAWEAEK